MNVASAVLGAARSPRATFSALAQAPSWRVAAGATLAVGAAWSGLLLWLHGSGHAPSGPLLAPIPREDYYLAQALFVVPLLFLLWMVASSAAHLAARRLGGGAAFAVSSSTVALALATPALLAFLAVDAAVLAFAGFDAMSGIMRFTMPLSALWTISLLTIGLGSAHHLSTGRAVVAALAGWLAQALVGAPLLR